MTEYEPDDHHGDTHHEAPDAGLPDHQHPDDPFAEQHLPPLDDLGTAHAPLPDELHFPGDDDAHDAAPADLDPTAPWPDDDQFSQWLGGPEHAAPDEAPGSDAELRDQLAGPTGDTEGLPPSDSLIDWTLRRLGDS